MEELLIQWLHRARFFTESLQHSPPSPINLIRPAFRDRDKPLRSRDPIPGGQYGEPLVEPNTALFNLVLKAMHGGKESEVANVEYSESVVD
ncbi:hypothetical protein RchiOBHm_Chr5g0021621 [Rosa chinensis]|uniref:Uncharacterized protein n=1 Tax=Rosa chinensis TaxID=74649 RepID=A0A2P6Q7N1_ROSCH|nr:hypothetical protein RchiOBHm_Chr5g0021621 [Rosa chinensis]